MSIIIVAVWTAEGQSSPLIMPVMPGFPPALHVACSVTRRKTAIRQHCQWQCETNSPSVAACRFAIVKAGRTNQRAGSEMSPSDDPGRGHVQREMAAVCQSALQVGR